MKFDRIGLRPNPEFRKKPTLLPWQVSLLIILTFAAGAACKIDLNGGNRNADSADALRNSVGTLIVEMGTLAQEKNELLEEKAHATMTAAVATIQSIDATNTAQASTPFNPGELHGDIYIFTPEPPGSN
ncbi:MAG: hypothetical protein UT08_C0020G0006 [Candidatus Woesebacteria bacterium GW2011_GWB1_38_8]|uniref:Uncharacterized protein n=1 Tax=Candidatus Woesebacteria bacterium GW2011_GWB1_38_8 TaxID=1618570 RepID=A0A0G0KZT3_9BACT|nr:MAG: hypothetical protein UT08_C0020G0006 [Candidatus Woesebacteria bacterium GW2011_GWB1_38_8]